MTTRHGAYNPIVVTSWSRRLRNFQERIERGRPKDGQPPELPCSELIFASNRSS
jgi:hypothetical protein